MGNRIPATVSNQIDSVAGDESVFLSELIEEQKSTGQRLKKAIKHYAHIISHKQQASPQKEKRERRQPPDDSNGPFFPAARSFLREIVICADLID